MIYQPFFWINKIFITKNLWTYNLNPIDSIGDVVVLNHGGLWGNNGLIEDYNVQESFINYDAPTLEAISNLIANGLIHYSLQWKGAYSPIYYYGFQGQKDGVFNYYNYKNPIKVHEKFHGFFKKINGNPLMVGQKISQGTIGKWYYGQWPTVHYNRKTLSSTSIK